MLRTTLRRLPPLPKRPYSTNTKTTHPPRAGPYKPTSASTPPPNPPKPPTQTTPQPANPSTSSPPPPAPATPAKEPLDPARGAAASLKAAREGVLDPRYRGASRRVVAIICAVPIFLVTSWVLFQRTVLGVEQKRHVSRGVEGEGDGEVEVVGEGVGVVDGK